jgi:hypothetical protein
MAAHCQSLPQGNGQEQSYPSGYQRWFEWVVIFHLFQMEL